MIRHVGGAMAFAAVFACSCLGAQTPIEASLPATPAGVLVHAWLDAFRSGDTNRILDYYRRYDPSRPRSAINLRLGSGGLDLLSVERAEPRHIEVVVKEHNTAQVSYVTFDLKPTDPPQAANASISPMGPNASLAALRVDARARKRVIEGAIGNLDSFYVFPDVARRIADSLRTWNAHGRYDAYEKSMAFAEKLSSDVREVSHDKHMRVSFSPRPIPPLPAMRPVRTPEDVARDRAMLDQLNCGFVKAEQLEGNVGYLKFNGFADVGDCGATASAAMNFLAATRALIVDLRDNGGGSPAMVTYVASYLFSKRTHLNDLWVRTTNGTEEFWTRDDVPGRKFGGDKPVYVLTSARTFSGAEEFAYDLQSQKRATIVGEVTGGGAHPVAGRRIDEHFMIGVPGARAINPVTHTNWEGVGIQPDVKVSAEDALATAVRLIRDAQRP